MAIEAGQNLAYVKDLIKRYDAAMRSLKKAGTPEEVTQIEREIHPVLKEMQLAIPRVWDDFSRATRNRRIEIREKF